MAEAFLVEYPDLLRVITPFNREFVDALKDAIPYMGRRYHPDSRTWTVDREYEDDLRALVSEYWTVETLYPNVRQTPSTPPCNTTQCLGRVRAQWPHHTALGLWPEAPACLVLAAYRALAREYHPDHRSGAGHEQMVTINRAYDALKSDVHGRTG